jgi:hypothetical protein
LHSGATMSTHLSGMTKAVIDIKRPFPASYTCTLPTTVE